MAFPHNPGFCEQRGYHGPFANLERYSRSKEWRGVGDCVTCGSTRFVPREEERRSAVVAARYQSGELAMVVG